MHRLLGSTDMEVGTLITYHYRHPVEVLCPINAFVKSEQTIFSSFDSRCLPRKLGILHLMICWIRRRSASLISRHPLAQVQHEAAVEQGEVIEIDNEDSELEDEEKSPEMTTAEVMKLCCTLKTVCLSKRDPTQSMELSRALRQFWGNIQREETKNARQLSLSEAGGASSNK
ncbi:hypothetical protein B0H17DRAFT_1185332 [Mycena rosella]|uniref:Uncharacterized protein n=1 Tax=Mycena rosella TaxID=1033263 RepID=A0AAD7G545_MYCRO|nr:hypothetical protein B0H17DRAFT_1185332 [Mycena rosella]